MSNVKYDAKQDILYLDLGRKSQESVPRGGFIIDISAKGKIAGLEVLNASKALSKLLDQESADLENVLENIQTADIVVKEVQGIAFMVLRIVSELDGEQKETRVPMEVPQPVQA